MYRLRIKGSINQFFNIIFIFVLLTKFNNYLIYEIRDLNFIAANISKRRIKDNLLKLIYNLFIFKLI